MRYLLTVLITLMVFASACWAGLHKEMIEYEHNGERLCGYLAYKTKSGKKQPGILLIHEWWGLNEFAKEMAERLAAEGFVVFALDMYGKGKVAETAEEAEALSAKIKADPRFMRTRALAGLDILKAQSLVDNERLAVVGFSLGGRIALELAAAGEAVRAVKAVVSFYGPLKLSSVKDFKKIKASLLILHPSLDSSLSSEGFLSLWKELDAAGINWKAVIYGGAAHGFSNPMYGDDPSFGAAFNRYVASDAWKEMILFFNELLKE